MTTEINSSKTNQKELDAFIAYLIMHRQAVTITPEIVGKINALQAMWQTTGVCSDLTTLIDMRNDLHPDIAGFVFKLIKGNTVHDEVNRLWLEYARWVMNHRLALTTLFNPRNDVGVSFVDCKMDYEHGSYYDEEGDPFDADNAANWDGDQQIGFRD
jgi:hypothetical protein